MSAEDLEKYETEMELCCTAIQRHRGAVQLRRRNRAALLPGQQRRAGARGMPRRVYFGCAPRRLQVWDAPTGRPGSSSRCRSPSRTSTSKRWKSPSCGCRIADQLILVNVKGIGGEPHLCRFSLST